MAAGSHNFKVEQGADFNNTITYEDASGNKINISGAAITLSNPSQGQFTIAIPAATTATYNWNRAFYDLDITISNVVTRLLQGQVQVIKSVSG